MLFFACCKGRIVIHTTEVDGTEIKDIEEIVKKDLYSSTCLALFFTLSNDQERLCIFDDVMNEVSSNATVPKLFMCGRSHLGCSLVLI